MRKIVATGAEQMSCRFLTGTRKEHNKGYVDLLLLKFRPRNPFLDEFLYTVAKSLPETVKSGQIASRASAGRGAEAVESSCGAEALGLATSSETPATVGSTSHASAGRSAEFLEMAHELTQALVTRVERLAAGGEIPCLFTTLTTAICHWQDLAACLETYENAVLLRRHGRRDPLEPSERRTWTRIVAGCCDIRVWLHGLPATRWSCSTGMCCNTKMDKESSSGARVASCTCIPLTSGPRCHTLIPQLQTRDGVPNEESMHVAQQFAAVHEEYLTNWSLGKAEKWSFQEVENGVARRARCSSPVHTDSDLDGDVACAPVRAAGKKLFPSVKVVNDVFSKHEMLPDMDFVRVFVDGVSMSYEVNADGSRKRVQLSAQQVRVLDELNGLDPQWHPCQISVAQKQLLMNNNCQLVRRALRQCYRRLTDKCNMHDRHSGVGVEAPAVYVEVQDEQNAPEPVAECSADVSRAGTRVSLEL
eukprot:s92_g14.t1